MNVEMSTLEDFARKMDNEDELSSVRDEFFLIEDNIYMDGNSMGLFPKAAEKSLMRVLEDYKRLGIDAWGKTNPPMFLYQDYLGNLMAPLVGAEENEVTIHANTTLNVHSMIATFYKPNEKKNKILIEDLNFPTGRYAIESQIKLKGLKVEEVLKEVKSRDGVMVDEDAIIACMTDDVAVAFLPSVLYRSGQLLDIEKITKAANEKNIIIGWDCCHSVGAVQHEFTKWNVDFAVWCTYKYLNGGPGASAALYINKKHHQKEPGLTGWHGYIKDKQFDLNNKFKSASNAGGWQTGTQNILSMAPLEGSLEIFRRIGMNKIRNKSLKLTGYLMYLVDEELSEYGFSVGNPREDSIRGGHVALVHDDAIRINEALKNNGVTPDFRNPNVIRLAPIALYTSYYEVYMVVQIIKKIMDEKLYEKYENKRGVIA